MHLVITLILAFCSISYELILAQSLSAIMGNTLLRYNVTIGLYLASLGAGSMVYNKGKGQSLRKRLIQVEILLTLFGSLSCFAIIFFEFTCRKFAGTLNLAMDGFFMDWFVFLGSHLMIIIFGFLSGFELPLLMDSGKEKGYSENTVLAVDYFGTLIGAVSFPLILMPNCMSQFPNTILFFPKMRRTK